MNSFYRPLRTLRSIALCTLILSTPVVAASTLIDLKAEANLPVRNDLAQATVSAESTGATPGDLAKQVNSMIADALKTAKYYSTVKTQSAGISTYPIYSKNGKIEMWRMRAEITLESVDLEALSELLGKLQSKLGVSNLVMQPTPETRKKAQNEAMLNALAAFKSRAKLIADAMGKPYSIKQISINTGGRITQPMFRSTAKSMLMEAAAMPMEAGESQISVMISGEIELN